MGLLNGVPRLQVNGLTNGDVIMDEKNYMYLIANVRSMVATQGMLKEGAEICLRDNASLLRIISVLQALIPLEVRASLPINFRTRLDSLAHHPSAHSNDFPNWPIWNQEELMRPKNGVDVVAVESKRHHRFRRWRNSNCHDFSEYHISSSDAESHSNSIPDRATGDMPPDSDSIPDHVTREMPPLVLDNVLTHGVWLSGERTSGQSYVT